MLVLTIRTDNPQAELGLYDGTVQLAYISWEAHRKLSDTIHYKLKELLQSADKDWNDLRGILCYMGPGSFTGLRIGISVGNALAVSLNIPIVAEIGDNWLKKGLKNLEDDKGDKIITPEYGAAPHITLPRK